MKHDLEKISERPVFTSTTSGHFTIAGRDADFSSFLFHKLKSNIHICRCYFCSYEFKMEESEFS